MSSRSDAGEPCGVTKCPALAVDNTGFCAVHRGAKRAAHVMAGTVCEACGRRIEPGDWITEASTMSTMTHASCPPPRPFYGRKKDRVKPLLEGGESC